MVESKTYGLTHLAIAVQNVKRTREFYRNVFGMETMYNQEGFVQLTTPGCHDIVVFEEHNSPRIGQSGGIAHFGFRLKDPNDIHEIKTRIVAAGGKIVGQGEFVKGSPYIFFKDLDGYEVEVWYELLPASEVKKRNLPSHVKIRSCDVDDFPAIVVLLQQLWTTKPLDLNALQAVYSRAVTSLNQKLIVSEAEEKVVGFCSLTIKNSFWQAGNIGVVDELIVAETHRGNGIGKLLMEKAEQIARDNNCKRIELESSFHREEAHQFYKGIGFKPRAYWFTKTIE
jgi:GNAT superfamily N-acetyltransferase/catechol 2,3-dioxygenase-like lactoylglutathione lyase family enzyme